jgi:uncharacterized membrane protein YedE/YeeE
MDIILAVILGTSFGFVLHRVGASNPENIINMLRLSDFHLMKVILLGIAVASSFLFLGLAAGAISPGHLSVKASYWGVLAGGAVLGAGWAVAGYCPGTGVVALGDGRKDALFFVLGGLVGAFLYMVVYSKLKGTLLLEKILGGKVTLALTPNESFKALIEGVPGVVVALVVALTFGLVVWVLPNKSR